MIAETVVGLSSVRPRDFDARIGPSRRIASITWKRLMARISSGSAVFMRGWSASCSHIICFGRRN